MLVYTKTIGFLSLLLMLFLGVLCLPAQAASSVVVGDFSAFEPPVESSDVQENASEWVDTAENRVFSGDFSAFENMDESTLPKAASPVVESNQFLMNIAQPDPHYKGTVISLTPADRDLLERIVMGECSSSREGATLVAQCLRDGMIYGGYQNASQVRAAYRYYVSPQKPNQYAVEAVQYVFDQGNSAVQHRILYFYAPKTTSSSFHESQNFVIEYGGHRYFDIR